MLVLRRHGQVRPEPLTRRHLQCTHDPKRRNPYHKRCVTKENRNAIESDGYSEQDYRKQEEEMPKKTGESMEAESKQNTL